MRDIYTRINNLRRQVFSAVANLASEDRDLREIRLYLILSPKSHNPLLLYSRICIAMGRMKWGETESPRVFGPSVGLRTSPASCRGSL